MLIHWILDCRDSKKTWDNGDCRWSLRPSCIWEYSFCTTGSVWVNCACPYTWIHIKEMDSSWLATGLACDKWSQWHPSRLRGTFLSLYLSQYEDGWLSSFKWKRLYYCCKPTTVIMICFGFVLSQIVDSIKSFLNISSDPATFIQVCVYDAFIKEHDYIEIELQRFILNFYKSSP